MIFAGDLLKYFICFTIEHKQFNKGTHEGLLVKRELSFDEALGLVE
jgi:hypothetical protein